MPPSVKENDYNNKSSLKEIVLATGYMCSSCYIPPSRNQEIERTNLLLPYSEISPEQCNLYLPTSCSKQKGLDEYLSTNHCIMKNAERLISKGQYSVSTTPTKKRSLAGRVLHVYQREMGHTTCKDNDFIVSDDATTCHILGFFSTSKSTSFTSMAHVDKPGYDTCLRSIILEHERYHMSQDIEIHIHILGGFNDEDQSSRAISQHLLKLLVQIANSTTSKLVLQTCLISTMNDDINSNQPIGRGLALSAHTGEAFLVDSIHESAQGPLLPLRSARIYSCSDTLACISSEDSTIRIDPFCFGPDAELDFISRLSNNLILKYTSTSPEAENADFCDKFRETVRYMNTVDYRDLFGVDCNTPLLFKRDTNGIWKII